MKRFTDFITIALSLLIIAASSVNSQETERKTEASFSLNQSALVYQAETAIK